MRCSMLKWVRLAIMLLSTAHCAKAPSDVCPPVVTYDAATRIAAADELAALPQQSVLPRFLVDYAALRAMARACTAVANP